jgi:hypothetical protein
MFPADELFGKALASVVVENRSKPPFEGLTQPARSLQKASVVDREMFFDRGSDSTNTRYAPRMDTMGLLMHNTGAGMNSLKWHDPDKRTKRPEIWRAVPPVPPVTTPPLRLLEDVDIGQLRVIKCQEGLERSMISSSHKSRITSSPQGQRRLFICSRRDRGTIAECKIFAAMQLSIQGTAP